MLICFDNGEMLPINKIEKNNVEVKTDGGYIRYFSTDFSCTGTFKVNRFGLQLITLGRENMKNNDLKRHKYPLKRKNRGTIKI